VFLSLKFCVFFWLSLDYFVFVMFAFVVLGLVSYFLKYYAKRLAGKNVSKMTYFVLSGM